MVSVDKELGQGNRIWKDLQDLERLVMSCRRKNHWSLAKLSIEPATKVIVDTCRLKNKKKVPSMPVNVGQELWCTVCGEGSIQLTLKWLF